MFNGVSFAAARASPIPRWHWLGAAVTCPTGTGNTPRGSPAPQLEHPALHSHSQLPRLPLEWLQERCVGSASARGRQMDLKGPLTFLLPSL